MHGVSGIGYALVAVGGVAVGWLVCLLVLRRPTRGAEKRASPAGSLDAEVIRRSTTGYLVIDRTGRPLLANPRAGELGMIRSGIVDPRIVSAASRAQVSNEPVDVEFRPAPVITALDADPNAPAVHAVVRAIEGGRIFVSGHDESAAQRLEAARRDFVANVSHELKTPVSAMGLLAEATVDAADDPAAVHRFAGKLQAEAQRLGSLVNELIALSRLQGADPLPDMAVVEVDAVIDATVARTATAAENAGITITQDGPSGLLVKGDRALLVTALTNLVDNAINYSPNGTQVSLTRTERDGTVQIAVTDRGVGIPVEHQERVFERFFRVDPARSRATGGTGLGLAIVKHVASIHGGSAGLWSRPGTGSTFTLRLPALDAPASADPALPAIPTGVRAVPSEPAAGPAARPPRPGQLAHHRTGTSRSPVTKVLIVEDEESMADPLSFLLRKEGFSTEIVGNGPDALVEYDRNGADIVLLDVMLPGMSGTEVCRQLRARGPVPVIMVTARDSEIDKVVGLELGADDYITKPYSTRELVARIRAVLRRGSELDEPESPILQAGPVRMDVDRHVVHVGGNQVSLPLKEFDLLEYLIRNSGRVLTRGQLIDRIWGSDYVGDTKTLDVHVKRLRAKIEPDPSDPRYLITVRGLGYKLEA